LSREVLCWRWLWSALWSNGAATGSTPPAVGRALASAPRVASARLVAVSEELPPRLAPPSPPSVESPSESARPQPPSWEGCRARSRACKACRPDAADARNSRRSSPARDVTAAPARLHCRSKKLCGQQSLTAGSARCVEGCPDVSAQVSRPEPGCLGRWRSAARWRRCARLRAHPRPPRQPSGRSAPSTDRARRRPGRAAHAGGAARAVRRPRSSRHVS
jgi:hypothetical protein